MSLALLPTVLISVSPALSLQDCEKCQWMPGSGDLFLLPDSPARVWSFPVSLEAVMVGKVSVSDSLGPAPEEGVLPSSLQCPAAQRLSEFPGIISSIIWKDLK